MKSDLSLGDLKKAKKVEIILMKKELDFFYSEFSYETRTSLFIAFSLLRTQNWFIFCEKFNFKILCYRKYLN